MSSSEATPVPIRGAVILLGQLIKILGLIATGGEVKEFLYDAKIEVNGEPENRRGRKLYDGDLVTLPDGSTVRIEAEFPRPKAN